jgi:hypothetical protein
VYICENYTVITQMTASQVRVLLYAADEFENQRAFQRQLTTTQCSRSQEMACSSFSLLTLQIMTPRRRRPPSMGSASLSPDLWPVVLAGNDAHSGDLALVLKTCLIRCSKVLRGATIRLFGLLGPGPISLENATNIWGSERVPDQVTANRDNPLSPSPSTIQRQLCSQKLLDAVSELEPHNTSIDGCPADDLATDDPATECDALLVRSNPIPSAWAKAGPVFAGPMLSARH